MLKIRPPSDDPNRSPVDVLSERVMRLYAVLTVMALVGLFSIVVFAFFFQANIARVRYELVLRADEERRRSAENIAELMRQLVEVSARVDATQGTAKSQSAEVPLGVAAVLEDDGSKPTDLASQDTLKPNRLPAPAEILPLENDAWLSALETLVKANSAEFDPVGTSPAKSGTEAVELAREAIAEHLARRPRELEEGPRVYRAVAGALEVLGEWRKAEKTWGRIVTDPDLQEADPKRRAAESLRWGTARMMAGDDNGAADVLATVVKAQPENGVAWLRLAVARFNGGEVAGARTALDAASGLLSGDQLAHCRALRALAWVSEGRLKEGQSELRLALAADPTLAAWVEDVPTLRPLLAAALRPAADP